MPLTTAGAAKAAGHAPRASCSGPPDRAEARFPRASCQVLNCGGNATFISDTVSDNVYRSKAASRFACIPLRIAPENPEASSALRAVTHRKEDRLIRGAEQDSPGTRLDPIFVWPSSHSFRLCFSTSRRITSKDEVARFRLLMAGEAAFHKSRVASFAVREVTEPPAAGCGVLG